jgi:prephenate dehydratase
MLGYFGPEGTFTHQALLSLRPDAEATPFATVPLALAAVRSGAVEASVVPIENSVEGGVSATLDYLGALDEEPLQIYAEVLVEVSFDLAVRPGTSADQVERIITHPHAAAQCRGYVAANFPNATLVEKGSTAGAALEVSNPNSEFQAAICAPVATQLYGLEALASNIGDNGAAVTRFVLVGDPGPATPRTGFDKTTLVAYMRVDQPGALLNILQQLAGRGVNMCRIESRPTKTTLGSYCFSIDAEGHIDDSRMGAALRGLHRVCQTVVYLGSYPRADRVPPQVTQGASDDDYRSADQWFAQIYGRNSDHPGDHEA